MAVKIEISKLTIGMAIEMLYLNVSSNVLRESLIELLSSFSSSIMVKLKFVLKLGQKFNPHIFRNSSDLETFPLLVDKTEIQKISSQPIPSILSGTKHFDASK